MAAAYSDNEDDGNEDEEEILIKYYFYRGYEYKDILDFLATYHNIEISERTLHRRLRMYGLSRRNPEYDIDAITDEVRNMLGGPDCISGYRHVWHSLQLNGHQVPRQVVELLLRELDPDGCQQRKEHKLKRRQYHNAGPNAVWHADGYDKLKPYGFPVHGCIDGWSRRLLWLVVTRSNNSPDNIGSYFLDAVKTCGGCPRELVTDLGTENKIMASMQAFFRDDENAHRYVASPRNQRIEGYWSQYRRNRSSWWINLFKDLVETGELNTSDALQKDCLWFCFAELLQEDLNAVKEHWNTHRIRKSRHDTVPGVPDVLYYLPEGRGGESGLLLSVDDNKISYVENHLIEKEEGNEHFEYFQYVMDSLGLEKPTNWREALQLYRKLVSVSVSGA